MPAPPRSVAACRHSVDDPRAGASFRTLEAGHPPGAARRLLSSSPDHAPFSPPTSFGYHLGRVQRTRSRAGKADHAYRIQAIGGICCSGNEAIGDDRHEGSLDSRPRSPRRTRLGRRIGPSSDRRAAARRLPLSDHHPRRLRRVSHLRATDRPCTTPSASWSIGSENARNALSIRRELLSMIRHGPVLALIALVFAKRGPKTAIRFLGRECERARMHARIAASSWDTFDQETAGPSEPLLS